MSLIAPSSKREVPEERRITGSLPSAQPQTRADAPAGVGSGAGDVGDGLTLTWIIQAIGIDRLQVSAPGGISHFTPISKGACAGLPARTAGWKRAFLKQVTAASSSGWKPDEAMTVTSVGCPDGSIKAWTRVVPSILVADTNVLGQFSRSDLDIRTGAVSEPAAAAVGLSSCAKANPIRKTQISTGMTALRTPRLAAPPRPRQAVQPTAR